MGISESSVKRWVDSGRIRAQRTAGGHRRIPLPDLVRFVREEGRAVVRPELLGLEEVAGQVDPAQEDAYGAFQQALLDGSQAQARAILAEAYLAGRSVAGLVDDLLAPAMREVGALWQFREDGIFLEHRAVGLCESALEAVRGLLLPPQPGAPVAVGGGPADDPYTMPTHLAATVLAAEGLRTTDLGAFTPSEELARAAVAEGADLVWLAVSSASGAGSVRALAGDLEQALDQAGWCGPVVVGGPACRERVLALPPPCRLVPTMAELAALARGLRAAGEDGHDRGH
jgi:excisionase family DNA binding protein